MTTHFDTWLDELNNIGPVGDLDRLRLHIDSAPAATSDDEQETISLAKRVCQTRMSGGDIFGIATA